MINTIIGKRVTKGSQSAAKINKLLQPDNNYHQITSQCLLLVTVGPNLIIYKKGLEHYSPRPFL